MTNRENASQLLAIAAANLRADGRLPRGTMANVRQTLKDAREGKSPSGRIKYREGVTADILDLLSEALAS